MKKNKQPGVLRFLVMIRRTPTGYSADVPDLPGCVAAARTFKGIRRLITEAIGHHLEMMQQTGESILKPRQAIEFEIDAEAGVELCTWVEVRLPQPTAAK